MATTHGVMTPVLLAWSGGKDATLALRRLMRDARYRVVALLTTIDAESGRISGHGVRRPILMRQVEGLGLALIEARVPAHASNEDYEHVFADALVEARRFDPGVNTIAFGDLHLADVRAWREAQLARVGWHAVFPLWGKDTTRLARSFVDEGYRAIVCCVDTTQLDAAFCGREFDAALLDDLPASCDPCGEKGEFHTCVYAGPPWREPLDLVRGERTLRERRFQTIDLTGSWIKPDATAP